VNDWEVSYGDLLEVDCLQIHRNDIVFLSPQEAFFIIEGWRGM